MSRETDYTGILFIGDPHLADRVPGFRKDDFPAVVVGKLRWAIDYARNHRLLPVVLGDFFHVPRDNGNKLIVDLLDLLRGEILGVYGNHDCSRDRLGDEDTLSILAAAGRVRLLSADRPWIGRMNGTVVVLGGSQWGTPLPDSFDRAGIADAGAALVMWAVHHDLRFPGYEDSGRLNCRELPGIDVVVNGHIHRPLPDVVAGQTTWLNPGNITRIHRGDASRNRTPSVLRIGINAGTWNKRVIEVPHRPFDDVFHADTPSEPIPAGESLFVRGLAALESLRTARGDGLRAFLDANLSQFDLPVAEEIRSLLTEVLDADHRHDEPSHH